MSDALIISGLKKLPPGGGGVPSIPWRTVSFFRDNNWRSHRDDISLDEYTPNDRYSLPSSIHDKATWVAWNLPMGEVVTLMEDVMKDPPAGRPFDLGGAGICVDLVGTGQTETASLYAVGLNDKVSCFFHRNVRLGLGAIELFRDNNFGGSRSIIFLSEWKPSTLFSLYSWWLQDRISSVRWTTLGDRCQVTLYDNTDAGGDHLTISSATSGAREMSSLGDIHLNDRISAWKWEGINPKHEIIDVVKYVPPEDGSWKRYNTDTAGVTSSVEAEIDTTVTVTTVREVKTSTTDQHVAGITSTWTTEGSLGIDGLASAKTSFSVQLSYDYTHIDIKEETKQTTVTSDHKIHMRVPPHSRYRVVVDTLERELKDEVLKTKATRWYEERVDMGVQDDTRNNWYKRIEDVEVRVSGTLATRIEVKMLVEPA